MQRLTKEQAAIIGAYTGISVGPFSDIHGLAERVLGRPIWTDEFANEALMVELRVAVKPMLLEICFEGDTQ